MTIRLRLSRRGHSCLSLSGPRHGSARAERKAQSQRVREQSGEGEAEVSPAGAEAEAESRDLRPQQSHDRTGAAAVRRVLQTDAAPRRVRRSPPWGVHLPPV